MLRVLGSRCSEVPVSAGMGEGLQASGPLSAATQSIALSSEPYLPRRGPGHNWLSNDQVHFGYIEGGEKKLFPSV